MATSGSSVLVTESCGPDNLLELLRFEGSLALGVANLSHGVTEPRAQRLWEVYDSDSNGWLDVQEVSHLIKDMARAMLRRMERKITTLKAALTNPDASASLFAAFDTSGDGKVQHDEFITLATKGVRVLRDVLDPDDEAALRLRKRARPNPHGADDPSLSGSPSFKEAGKVTVTNPYPVQEGRMRLLMRAGSFHLPPPLMMRKESTIEATAQISDGVDEETAERLWATLDRDRNGVLDRSEVHAIFAMQCTQLIERLESEAKQLTTAVQELSTSAKVMLAMDVDGDGKIQRHEFIQAATAGFLIQMGSP